LKRDIPMERKTVRSSNIKSIGYNEITRSLEVEFNNGTIYEYYKVPKEVHDLLMTSASHGKYLNQYIKKKYAFKRVN
jgi:hypothetical protein